VQRARLDEGLAAWPGLDTDPAEFVRDLAAHLVTGEYPLAALSSVHAGDLYLAGACRRGSARAIALFEARFLARVPAFVAQVDPTGALADDVCQDLRDKLLLSTAGSVPRIGDYSGRGDLSSWLRVVALRTALRLRRSQRRHGVQVADPPGVLGGGPDPERDYLRMRYGGEYQAAFSAALAALEPGERLLLKLHYVDGLNIERIGALFQLHRSTVARRLHGQRRKLLELTRARLRERLSLSDSEFDSVLALVRSQMVVSLRTALK
jgi:RNA polymerase sigma-70 factor (ECF subfamily)